MSEYKLSQYNIVLPIQNDEFIIWNTKTGSIVSLEKELWDCLNCHEYQYPIVTKNLKDLLKQGVVVSSKLNEWNQIVYKQKSFQLSDSNSLDFVIAPTLECNYHCSYCFEKSKHNYPLMDDVTIANIFACISDQLRKRKRKKLTICWFGGEPLLGFCKVIMPLSKQLISFCSELGIEYEARIITNGYFLERRITEELINSCKVRAFQITFDGEVKLYCEKKGVRPEAYYRVKDNVFSLSKIVQDTGELCKINIRLNVDKDNLDSISNFLTEIKSDDRYIDNMNFYLGKIVQYNSNNCSSFSLKEFEEVSLNFNSLLNRESKFPNPRHIWCKQHTMNCLCIGPMGEFYKCEHDFGDDSKCIGDVVNGITFSQYLLNFLFQNFNENCKACQLFPICLGGCPNIRLDTDSKDCYLTMDTAIRIAIEHYNRCMSQ